MPIIAGKKSYVFRDPIYGLIEILDPLEANFIRRVLETREMQRLRRISQNGVTNLVYPGLEGSRFSHALGSFAVATKLIQSLSQREPTVADGYPSSFRLTADDRRAFALAAILHDVGHGPFSHLWEECFDDRSASTPRHEVYGHAAIDSQDTDLARIMHRA